MYPNEIMLKHIVINTYRAIVKNWHLHLLNSLGLIASFIVCFVVGSYFLHETSYDSFHKNTFRKYLVQMNYTFNGSTIALPPPSILFEKIKLEASIKKATRVYLSLDASIRNLEDNDKIKVSGSLKVDSDFFDVFKYEPILGNTKCIFEDANNVIVTKYFIDKLAFQETSIGQTFMMNNRECTICAVLDNNPTNSSLKFDIVSATSSSDSVKWEDDVAPLLYFEINETKNVDGVLNRLNNLISDYYGDNSFTLEPILLTDQHFKSDLLPAKGDQKKITLFLIIGVITLLIALTNYLNINAIILLKEAKTIGVKRLLGASSNYFVSKYFIESFLLVTIISLVSYSIIILVKERISILMELPEGFYSIYNLRFSLFAISIILISIILVTILLLIINSRNKPIDLLKTNSTPHGFGKRTMTLVVLIQFIASSILILYTLLILKQSNFLEKKDIGFDKENKIIIRFHNENLETNVLRNYINEFRNDIINYPLITGTSLNSMPGFSSIIDVKLRRNSVPLKFYVIESDEYGIDLMGLTINDGRSFTKNRDATGEVILNQTAFNLLSRQGYSEMLGQPIIGLSNSKVVGIVKDFYFNGFNKPLGHLIIKYNPSYHSKLFISYKGQYSNAKGLLKTRWEKVFKDQPFESTSFDFEYDRLYFPDKSKMNFFVTSTIISILISSLGLFGLSLFMITTRRKEMSIRKIHGASFWHVTFQYLKKFISPILGSYVLAIPAFFILANRFLENYEYKTKINFSFFIISLFIQIAIVILVVSYHTITSALIRPIRDLNRE